jgi:hypothetical protein
VLGRPGKRPGRRGLSKKEKRMSGRFKSRAVVSKTVFRSRTVEYRDDDGKRISKGSPGYGDPKRKVVVRTKNWYGRFRDPATGTWASRALSPDKIRSRQMLSEIEAQLLQDETYRKAGVKPESAEQGKRPLAEHLEDYRRFLAAKGSSERQVSQVISRVRQVLDGCSFVLMGDINASFVHGWLADRRKAPPAKGKRQRFSVRTSNHYLSAIKSFTRWLVKDRRMKADDDPLPYLSGGNPDPDIRHARRDLPAEDFDRLVEAARKGNRFASWPAPIGRSSTCWRRARAYAAPSSPA